DAPRYRDRPRTLFIVLPGWAVAQSLAGLGQLCVQRLQRVERGAQLVGGLGAEPRAHGPDRRQVTENVAYRHEALQVFQLQTGPGGLDDRQVRVEVDVGQIDGGHAPSRHLPVEEEELEPGGTTADVGVPQPIVAVRDRRRDTRAGHLE